jgi:3-methyladenine DNA glycosylase AlkD
MPAISEERIRNLRREIRAWCEEHTDPQQAAKYARFFREGWDAWGVHDDESWAERRRQWLEGYLDLKLGGFLRLGEDLFATGKYEEAGAGIWLVAQHKPHFNKRTLPAIGKWFAAGVNNWAHTDVICGQLLGHLLESCIAPLDSLGPWRTSARKYQRRAVPVSMLALLDSAGNYEVLLEFIRPMMLDPERVVQQGLGWFLREVWKRQPKPVEKFLQVFKDSAPRLIFQYATEKMTPGQKARFRRAKAAAR